MLSTAKLKCPHCQKQVLKRILSVTKGKCNNCGYLLVNSITQFVVPVVTNVNQK